jgi:hypothetical protein
MRSPGALAILCAMALLWICIPLSTQDSNAVGRPVVTIRLGQDRGSVAVGPGDTGTATFTGEVTVAIPLEVRTQYLIVSLIYAAGSETQPWTADGTSQVIFPKGVNTQQFTCSVKVPLGTPYLESGILTVTGTWRYSPGSESGDATPDSAGITIAPYSQPVLKIDLKEAKVEKNGIAEFRFTLENRGNGPDEFKLSASYPAGMIVEDDFPDKLVLGMNERADFTIKARSNAEGEKKVFVTVTGSFQTSTQVSNETLVLKVESKDLVTTAKGYMFPGIGGLLAISLVGGGGYFFLKHRKSARRSIRPG